MFVDILCSIQNFVVFMLCLFLTPCSGNTPGQLRETLWSVKDLRRSARSVKCKASTIFPVQSPWLRDHIYAGEKLDQISFNSLAPLLDIVLSKQNKSEKAVQLTSNSVQKWKGHPTTGVVYLPHDKDMCFQILWEKIIDNEIAFSINCFHTKHTSR